MIQRWFWSHLKGQIHNIFLAYIVYSKRPPLASIQRLLLELKFWVTLCRTSSSMDAQNSRIFSLMSSMVNELDFQISFSMYPQKKKSSGFRSGDRGGQGKPDLEEINLSGKRSLNQSIESFAVCGVAPSCWKNVSEQISGESSGKKCSSIST